MIAADESSPGRPHHRRIASRAAAWAGNAATWLTAALLSSDPAPSARWLGRTWLLTLFIGGGLAWTAFLNRGSIDFTRHDWIEAGHRYAFLRDAAQRGLLPLHMSGEWALRNVTDRFASVADTNLSPLVYLLRFMGIGRFVLLQTLLLYAAGFVGLLLLRRRYGLSPLAFTVLFLLLFFNGHVVAHLAVGHVHWGTYLLTPYFLWLVFDVLEGVRHPWRWTLCLSAYMLIILLQGAFHLYTMSAFFLGVLALSLRGQFGLVLRGLIFATLAGAIRLLPPLLHASEYDTAFLFGFTTLGDLFDGLVRLIPPIPELALHANPLNSLGWWEMDYFIGFTGLIFLAAFAAYSWLGGGKTALGYRRLILPLAVLAASSVGRAYELFHDLKVPLLSTQRVSSRVLFVPLSILVLLSVIGFQRWLNRRKILPVGMLTLAAGVWLLAQDLWTHFDQWQVANMPALFITPGDVDMSLDIAANHPDPAYLQVLLIGLSISIATILTLGYLSWKEMRRSGKPIGGPFPHAATVI